MTEEIINKYHIFRLNREELFDKMIDLIEKDDLKYVKYIGLSSNLIYKKNRHIFQDVGKNYIYDLKYENVFCIIFKKYRKCFKT